MSYIKEKMATVGAGSSDITEAKTICDAMTTEQRDVLDCWHNNGFGIPLKPAYFEVAGRLKRDYSEDDLIVLGAYVSARRNTEAY